MAGSEYGAKDITVLEGLEAVRRRPGMYIGSTGPRGLHHLVYEALDNSVDEALAGYCDRVEVTTETASKADEAAAEIEDLELRQIVARAARASLSRARSGRRV